MKQEPDEPIPISISDLFTPLKKLTFKFHLAEIENSQNHTDAVLLRHQNTTTLFLQISSERTTNLANHQICNMHNTPRSHASSSMERSDRSKGKRLSEYSKPKSPTHHSDSASRSSLKLHGTSVTSWFFPATDRVDPRSFIRLQSTEHITIGVGIHRERKKKDKEEMEIPKTPEKRHGTSGESDGGTRVCLFAWESGFLVIILFWNWTMIYSDDKKEEKLIVKQKWYFKF